MKKKITLNKLEVKSFITKIEDKSTKAVIGGGTDFLCNGSEIMPSICCKPLK